VGSYYREMIVVRPEEQVDVEVEIGIAQRPDPGRLLARDAGCSQDPRSASTVVLVDYWPAEQAAGRHTVLLAVVTPGFVLVSCSRCWHLQYRTPHTEPRCLFAVSALGR
jgi:hypothetical protein